MATQKRAAAAWSEEEVDFLVDFIENEKITEEFNNSLPREENVVFRDVSEELAQQGFSRSPEQCREKLDQLLAEYRANKDRKGKIRMNGRWFSQLHSLYGIRLSDYVGYGLDSYDIQKKAEGVSPSKSTKTSARSSAADHSPAGVEPTQTRQPTHESAPSFPARSSSSSPSPTLTPVTTCSSTRKLIETGSVSRKRSANGDLVTARRENVQADRPQLDCQSKEDNREARRVEDAVRQEELALRRKELELRKEEVAQQRNIADSLSRLVDLMAAKLSKN